MKKTVSLALDVVLALSTVLFTGCGDKATTIGDVTYAQFSEKMTAEKVGSVSVSSLTTCDGGSF